MDFADLDRSVQQELYDRKVDPRSLNIIAYRFPDETLAKYGMHQGSPCILSDETGTLPGQYFQVIKYFKIFYFKIIKTAKLRL